MLNNLKKRQSGFTIIEVLIVLAIAGLIMVAVFTAVPALQRSSRNTQRKSSASQIMASVSSYVGNNNGSLPTAATLTSSALNDYKPGFYLIANVLYGTFANPGTPTLDNAIFVSGAACNDTNTGIVAGASSRSYAILYQVESGSNAVLQCIGS